MIELMPWLKGIHVIGVLVWIGAMAVSITLLKLAAATDSGEQRTTFGELARANYLRFQSSGLGLVLVTGLVQMFAYIQEVDGWMKANRWIHWKIMLVVALLVVDHILMRRALQLRKDPEKAPAAIRVHVLVAVALVIATVFLATVQPMR